MSAFYPLRFLSAQAAERPTVQRRGSERKRGPRPPQNACSVVTFKYKDSATDQVRLCTVSAEEFMRRFLEPVLPERFVKVRCNGLGIMPDKSKHLHLQLDCHHSRQ